MVMELIEGETLAARIEKAALPLGQALKYDTRIAVSLSLRARFKHIDALTIKVPKSMLSFISKMPGVKYVTPNRSLRGSLEYAQPGVYANIAYRYNWTGAGIGVAIIDSGVNARGWPGFGPCFLHPFPLY